MSGAQGMPLAAADPIKPVATGDFWADLRGSFRNPGFWALASWLDIIVRARRSRFGVLWLMAPAAVYVFGMGMFFASMMSVPFATFAAHVALGAMVFRSLMSTVVGSAGVFHASQPFIMDGHVRLTDYLLQSLARSFFDLCMYLPFVIVALLMFTGVSVAGLLLAPFVLVLIQVNALWIGVVFSLMGARHPDVGQLISNTSIFLFLLTPIIWYPELMPADSIRGQLMRFNPFYHFVTLFRAPILGEPVEPMTYWVVAGLTVGGLALATWLYRRYARFVPLWI